MPLGACSKLHHLAVSVIWTRSSPLVRSIRGTRWKCWTLKSLQWPSTTEYSHFVMTGLSCELRQPGRLRLPYCFAQLRRLLQSPPFFDRLRSLRQFGSGTPSIQSVESSKSAMRVTLVSICVWVFVGQGLASQEWRSKCKLLI